MLMVKQQRKKARRAHSGAGERSCSGLHARRVQGAGSGVMTCSKHLISIMLFLHEGAELRRLFATSRCCGRNWNRNLQSELNCLLARYPSALYVCSVDSEISVRRHRQRKSEAFLSSNSDGEKGGRYTSHRWLVIGASAFFFSKTL